MGFNCFKKHADFSSVLPIQGQIYDLIRRSKSLVDQFSGHEAEYAKEIFSDDDENGRRRIYGLYAKESIDLHDFIAGNEFEDDLSFEFHFACDDRLFSSIDGIEKDLAALVRMLRGIFDEICPRNPSEWKIWKEHDMRYATCALEMSRHALRVYACCCVYGTEMFALRDVLSNVEKIIDLLNQTSYEEQLALFDKRSQINQERNNRRAHMLSVVGMAVSIIALLLSIASLCMQCSPSKSSELISNSIKDAAMQIAESTPSR